MTLYTSCFLQHVPGVQPEGPRRHVGALHQPAERLPHHQGGPEALQDTGSRGEGEGGHREAGLAGHQPEPQQPQTQRPLHPAQHRSEEDAGFAGGAYQRWGKGRGECCCDAEVNSLHRIVLTCFVSAQVSVSRRFAAIKWTFFTTTLNTPSSSRVTGR